MEPLSSAVIAISSLIFTKAFEKTGEEIGEAFSNQIGKFARLIRRKPLPKTQEIEAGATTIHYFAAVKELELASKHDAELSIAVEQLSQIIKSDPALYKKAQNTVAFIKNDPNVVQNQTKLAEKIGLIVQGGEVNIGTFNV